MVSARQRQRERFVDTYTGSNADMRPAQNRKNCVLYEPCQLLMKTAMRQLQLTAKAYHRVLKLSRTIANIAGWEAIISGAFGRGATVPTEAGFDVVLFIEMLSLVSQCTGFFRGQSELTNYWIEIVYLYKNPLEFTSGVIYDF